MKKVNKKQKLIIAIAIILIVVILVITNNVTNNSQMSNGGYLATTENANSNLIARFFMVRSAFSSALNCWLSRLQALITLIPSMYS